MSADFDTAKPAYLRLAGWAGRQDYAIMVVGETPKRYRIRGVIVEGTPLPGRRLQQGQVALVPKSAVRFAI